MRDASLRGVAPTGGSGARPGKDDDGTDEEEEAREIEAAKEELRRLSAEQERKDASSDATPSSAATSGGMAATTKKTGALTHAQKYGQWDRYDVDGVVSAMEEREADRERVIGIACSGSSISASSACISPLTVGRKGTGGGLRVDAGAGAGAGAAMAGLLGP